ncbi:ABC transporter permease [Nocardioides salarius]|uniref:ABC transporter permease n=1 Tax=Nocardioides salarius TaxID=374513 RepID=UPI0030F7DC0C
MTETRTPLPAAPAVPESGPSLAARLLHRPDVGLFAALVLVVALASGIIVNFASTVTLGFLLVGVIPVLLLAMPMTLIIITGEIDLSVASTAGLASAVMGVLWRDTDLSIWVVMTICVAVGALCGAFNGLLITRLGLSSLAVTIGTLALFRGLALVVIGDQKVSDFPSELTRLATRRIGETGVPVAMVGVVVLVAVFAVVLHQTPFGRSLYALGFSSEAARFAGIRVDRAKLVLFTVSGAIAGVTGVFWTLRYASAGPDNATGLELTVIAAVLLGGVSIFGGRGTVFGVVTGVLLIGTVTYALRLARVPETALTIVTGALLILSVVTPSLLAALRERRRLARLTSTSSPSAPAGG